MPESAVLREVAQVVDCEHKTAPMAEPGTEFGYSIGTADLKAGRIEFSSAKRVDRKTFDEWSRRAVLGRGDLILAREAPVGQVAYVDGTQPVCLGQRTVLIRPDSSRVDSRYLHYRLLGPAAQSWMSERAAGSTVPHLNVADVRLIPLLDLPTLEEQRQIGDVLGALDDLVDTNLALIKHCAVQVRCLYLRMMATAETELTPFFEVFDVDFGAPFKGSQFNTSREGRPLLRIRDLKTFTSDVWTLEQRDDETIISPGDVVVGMDAEFRPTFWLGAPSLLNQRVCRVRARVAGPAFTREALVGPLAYIEGYKTGTTVSHLNKRDLAEIKIDVPAQSALAGFEAVAEPLQALIVELKQECDILAKARDELLPLLVSGRVRVEDVTA